MSDDIARFPRYPQRKGAAPSKAYACPDCGVKFIAKNSEDNEGRRGKTCPQGHWNTTSRLHKFTMNGVIGKRGKPAADSHKPSSSAHLRVALRMMLESYELMERTIPKRTIAHGMATAPFKGVVGLAREVLEGVL